MDLNFGKRVSYAAKERVESRWKFKETDDKGILSTIERGVQFRGKWSDFEIGEIRNVRIIKESPNFAHIFTGPLLCAIIYCSLGLLFKGWDAPSDIGIAEISCIIGSAALGEIIALCRRGTWIRVEYVKHDGRLREAFFKRSSSRNPEVLLNQLRKLAAGEDRIFQEAQEKLKEKSKGEQFSGTKKHPPSL